MTLKVMLFASARELLQQSEVFASLSEHSTVADLRVALEQYPQLKSLLPRCRIAVNQEFADDDQELSVVDEIAIIPPVSGGACP